VWRVLLIVSLVLSACTTSTRARALVTLPPSVWPTETQVRWYDVEGDSEAELRASLDARGPENDGARHDAYTAWYVNWRFPFQQSDEGCSTGPVTTTVRVTITLPRWRGYQDEHVPLMKRWRRYLDALKEHESGHRDTGFRAASEITEQLEALPPRPTCAESEAAANAAAVKVLERFRAVDADYDAETRHGATQGAVFP
jgi:predicted secreted Zn-dependent protease